jgi:hypothetical protein
MPIHRQRSMLVSRGSRRRKLVWGTLNIGSTALASGLNIVPVSVLANITVNGLGLTGGTVVRSHLRLSLTAADTDTNPGAFFGLCVDDNTITAAGKPDPSSDFGRDWMYVNFITPGTSPSSIAAPANAPTEFLYGTDVDIRSKRRLPEMNDDLFFVLKNSGSASLNYGVFIRSLVMLP